MHVIDNDIDPRLKPLLEQILLRGVIVAATAGDQQGAQRFFVRGGEFPGGEAGQCEYAGEYAHDVWGGGYAAFGESKLISADRPEEVLGRLVTLEHDDRPAVALHADFGDGDVGGFAR